MSAPAQDSDDLRRRAESLWVEARDHEQAARVVASDADATQIRAIVRRLARDEGVAVRTARMSDTVVVVRLDAAVWDEDAAAMRRKLSPDDA